MILVLGVVVLETWRLSFLGSGGLVFGVEDARSCLWCFAVLVILNIAVVDDTCTHPCVPGPAARVRMSLTSKLSSLFQADCYSCGIKTPHPVICNCS